MPRTSASLRSIAFSLSALCAMSVASAQTAAVPVPVPKTMSATQQAAMHMARASELEGSNVLGAQGKKVGEVEDLVLNLSTGEVRYAVMAFDPGFFKSEKLFAVPLKELTRGKDNKTLMYADTSRAALEKSGFEKADWKKAVANTRYLQGADKAYGFKPPANTERSFLASKLVGMDVKSRGGQDIGDVKDVVVNMDTGRIAFMVLAFDPSWTTAEKLYAFPSSAFTLVQDKDEVVLDVDKSMVASMKSFDANRWASLNDLNSPEMLNMPAMKKP